MNPKKEINKQTFKRDFGKDDVVILAGGLGTRVKGVLGNTPKLLAPVYKVTFFDLIINWLKTFGVSRVILCLGHLSEKVLKHLSCYPPEGIQLEVSVENVPLGTAGAIRHAKNYVTSNEVLVVNGDTWIDADLTDFLHEHSSRKADISILCANVQNVSRYANVSLQSDGRVLAFSEKTPSKQGGGIISAGFYLFSSTGLNNVIMFSLLE